MCSGRLAADICFDKSRFPQWAEWFSAAKETVLLTPCWYCFPPIKLSSLARSGDEPKSYLMWLMKLECASFCDYCLMDLEDFTCKGRVSQRVDSLNISWRNLRDDSVFHPRCRQSELREVKYLVWSQTGNFNHNQVKTQCLTTGHPPLVTFSTCFCFTNDYV